MEYRAVADGVGISGTEAYGPTWWINHIFLPAHVLNLKGGCIVTIGCDDTSLCSRTFSCLNAPMRDRPECPECDRIAKSIGKTYR